MKLKHYLGVTLGVLLASCGSVQQLTFDQLNPSEITFPSTVRSVGVVDNVALLSNEKESFLRNGYIEGDGQMSADELAKALSGSRYFDEVILSESPLRAASGKSKTLSRTTVDSLADAMQVDMVITIDRLPILVENKDVVLPDYPMPVPMTKAVSAPQLSFYFASKEKDAFRYSQRDSIFFDAYGELSLSGLKEEVSRNAMQSIVRKLVPSWTSVVRYFFEENSFDFRDAYYCVKEGDWNNALEICQNVYNKSKKATVKAKAAFNCAVISERINRLDDALIWLDLAKSQWKGSDVVWVEQYEKELKERQDALPKLNEQMLRFTKDRE